MAFKIYITQKCFLERRRYGELFEKLEDAMANLLAEYGLEGAIDDNITGNITCFPITSEYPQHNGKDCVEIESSHGIFYADPATGKVIGKEICCDKQPRHEYCNNKYTQINKFDFEEWREYYSNDAIDTHLDILDLGYWLENCLYTPAEKDHRENILEHVYLSRT